MGESSDHAGERKHKRDEPVRFFVRFPRNGREFESIKGCHLGAEISGQGELLGSEELLHVRREGEVLRRVVQETVTTDSRSYGVLVLITNASSDQEPSRILR